MRIALDLTFCHRCQCAHPFGQHKGKPPSKLSPALSQTPAAVALHSYADGTNGNIKPRDRTESLRPLYDSLRPKTPVIGLRKPSGSHSGAKFDKKTYQLQLMRDRREADKLGFGGSKATNPNYKTVKQFRAWRLEQAKNVG